VAKERVDGEAGPERAAAFTPIAPKVPESRVAPEGELAAAVDEAVMGDVFADLPEAQPDRALTSATDVSSLYVRHRSGLAAHARRFLRDSRDVDEVVQETFLRLFLAIDEIDTELQAIAFARRTLTNLCIDRYRADRRRPTLVNLDTAPLGELADGDEDDPVLRAEDAAIVREALAQLSPLHRAALVKREIEEKSVPQIAAELDVPEESVKHLLFRARRALRRLLVGTSVEPGVDLTAGEVMALANRRAGSAMMRGANVFIVLVVGALVAAFGVRSLEGRTPALAPAPDSTSQGQHAAGPGVAIPTRTPHHHVAGVTHHAAGRNTEGHQAPTTSGLKTPLLPTIAPVQQAPLHPVEVNQPASGGSKAPRSHFKLSGPLKVTGAPQVGSPTTMTADGGVTTTAASSFTAPTDEGTFELAQIVSTSPVQGDSVSVTPSFVVGNVVESPVMTGSAATVGAGPGGTVTVDVVASAQPDPSTNAFPLTSLSVHLVMTADLTSVLAETVALSAAPATSVSSSACAAAISPAHDAGPSLATGPCQPATTVGAGETTSGAGDTAVGGDTNSGPTPGVQAATPGVLEIPDTSGDDRAIARSFSTSGGASS
jgi:RNA polymerase sigma-70 factor (ECF subfamily)